MDHDDTLAPSALAEVAQAAAAHPEAGLFYSDEDKVSEDGEAYFEPHFKPDWSPDLMTNVNYITHLVAVRKDVARKAGPLDKSKDGAQDYDFLLRVIDTGTKIVHIPRVLYHWRAAEASTAQDFASKPHIVEAGMAALEAHLERNKLAGQVGIVPARPGFYEVTYEPKRHVTLIVPPFANPSILGPYIARLLAVTDAPKDGYIHLITSDQVAVESDRSDVRVTRQSLAGDATDFLRRALEKADDTVVLTTQVVLPRSGDWLNRLTGLMSLPRIGAAAPVVVNNENGIEDYGLVRGANGLRPLFAAEPLGASTYFGTAEWTRDVDALTGAVLVCRRADLTSFLNRRRTDADSPAAGNLLTSFSAFQRAEGRDIALWACVVMNNGGYWLQPWPALAAPSRFNPQLFWRGKDIRPYATERQLRNYLDSLAGQ